MIKINHIAIYVRDLEKSRKFYEKYFGAKSNRMYHNLKTGLKTYFLEFACDCRLEIMNKPGISDIETSDEHTGYIHLAFSMGDKSLVDSLTERLRGDGYAVFREPRVTGDGYYESCVSDPDGNRIEITG